MSAAHPRGLIQLMSNHQCRLCGHWWEGEWSAAGDAERAEIERQMSVGVCDPCQEEYADDPYFDQWRVPSS